jgi:polyphosphate glucokinase
MTASRRILGIDIGGSHVKVLLSGEGSEERRVDSSPTLTPQQAVDAVAKLTGDWQFDCVSIGLPAPVRGGRVVAEPVNLGDGWVGFDFTEAFGKPTRVVNDAAMQALGSYEGGRMLFLGFGTGLGSALIVDGVIAPLELGHLPFRKATFEDYVGNRGRKRLGRKKWQKAAAEAIERLSAALEPDYIVVGGGNAKKLEELPQDVRRGSNDNAFLGAFRLWDSSPRQDAG